MLLMFIGTTILLNWEERVAMTWLCTRKERPKLPTILMSACNPPSACFIRLKIALASEVFGVM